MKTASDDLDFERAARLRDEIAMLQTVMQQNSVVLDQDVDADVFGLSSDELEASVHVFFVRDGSIRGERNWTVERVEDIGDDELMSDLIVQVYADLLHERGSVQSSRTGEGAQPINVLERRDAIGATQSVTA